MATADRMARNAAVKKRAGAEGPKKTHMQTRTHYKTGIKMMGPKSNRGGVWKPRPKPKATPKPKPKTPQTIRNKAKKK